MSRRKDKPHQKTACRAYSVRLAPGASSRSDRVQERSAAKDTGKTKHLLKKLSKDLNDLSPNRAKIPEEKTNRGKNPKDLTQVAKKSDRGVSSSKPKVKVRGKTCKDESGQKKKLDKPTSSVGVKGEIPKNKKNMRDGLLSNVAAEDKAEEKPQISNSLEDRLTAKFTSSIGDYIMSPTFKMQLSERILEEISVQIAQVVSQSPEPRQSMSSSSVKAEASARSYLQEGTSKPGFSLSVVSLLCHELIETRDKIMEHFQSKSAELCISSNTEIEIVNNVFKNMFASLIDVETLHPDDTSSPDSMLHSFASHVFSGACESIKVSAAGTRTASTPAKESGVDLQSCQASSSGVKAEGISEKGHLEDAPTIKSLFEGIIGSGIDVSPVNEPTEKIDCKSGSDERAERGLLPESDFWAMFGLENSFQIRATFISKQIVKKLKSLLTSKTDHQDQLSDAEVESNDEDESEDEEENLDESILAAFFLPPETSEQELKPDEKSEEHLDQAMTSKKNIPSEADERNLLPSEQQELASPVPSPVANEQPESPKRTCSPEQTEEEKEKEEEGILHASESISNLHDPLTSRVVPEGVTETSGEVSNLKEALEEAETHFVASLPESPVSSPPFCEMPDSPQSSSCSPNEMRKTVNLESAENQEVKERFPTESKDISLPTSEPLDQDRSSGPDFNSNDEDKGEDESISAIEPDLSPDEDAEEQLVDESDVSLSCEATEQDLQLAGHKECSSPSAKEPDFCAKKMNRGSSYRDKPQHQTAFQAKGVRSSLGPSQRGHRVQEPSAGTAAKDTGKPKHLLKKSSKDPYVLSLIRTKVSKEKTNGQKTLPNIRAPGKGKPPPKDLNKATKSVSFAATPKVEVRGKTPTDETRAKKNADQKEKAPQMSNNTEEKLRAKITSAIINYIKSTPFKRQLSEHIVWEISIKISKAVSQYHEQQLAKRVCKAGAQSKNPARRCQREQSGKLGFSISVASLLGYELIESRDKMIEYFKSKSPELSTSSNAETEIVKNVFESILAFVINLETLHPLEDISTYSPDCMIDSFESILQNINSADSESPFREPTLSDDESITSLMVSTPADKSDVDPLLAKTFVPSKVDALKVEELDQQEHQENQERISGPRKLMEKIKNFLTPGASDQDQSSEVDAEEEVEDEKIQAAVIPATQTTDIELKNLVTDSGLDQATTSEENILSDVEKQDQELASRVPSPAASEKPDSPGESPKRTTCPPEQTRYSPNLPVSMPETSDTKTIAINPKEEDEHSLPRSDAENTVSLKSEGKEEEIEMPDPDQEAEEQLVAEPDVLDQVLATPSKVSHKATEKDLQLTRHEKRASPVPSFPYLEEPVSPRKSPLRSTRPTKRSRSVFSTKKGSVSTPNKLKESRIFSKSLDTKKSKAAASRKEPQQARSGNALKPVDSDSETSRTKPDVPEEKPSECDKGQRFLWRSSHKKILLHANKKRMDFSKCCTCDHQEQDQ